MVVNFIHTFVADIDKEENERTFMTTVVLFKTGSLSTEGLWQLITSPRVGHFEGDTIVGKDHKGAIVSLTEMKTKYQFVCKVQERSANEVQKSIEMLLGKHYPWIKTLTVDNGKEFTNHEQLAKNLDFKIFFCDPYSPWQRGLNENQNGLIRQYIPKSTSFENLWIMT